MKKVILIAAGLIVITVMESVSDAKPCSRFEMGRENLNESFPNYGLAVSSQQILIPRESLSYSADGDLTLNAFAPGVQIDSFECHGEDSTAPSLELVTVNSDQPLTPCDRKSIAALKSKVLWYAENSTGRALQLKMDSQLQPKTDRRNRSSTAQQNPKLGGGVNPHEGENAATILQEKMARRAKSKGINPHEGEGNPLYQQQNREEEELPSSLQDAILKENE